MASKRHQWTNQEVYNTVVRHLQVQGVQAKGFGGQCIYRSEVIQEGFCEDSPPLHAPLSCAVGCLIPKNKYNPEFENDVLSYRPALQALLTAEGMGGSYDLLERLQTVHDEDACWAVDRKNRKSEASGLPKVLTIKLREVAAEFGLEPIF